MYKEKYFNSKLFFMNTNDLHKITNQQKGVIVAIFVEDNTNPILAITVRLDVEYNYAEFLIWKGDKRDGIPSFYFKKRDQINSDIIDNFFYHVHFPLCSIKIIYLKQVIGMQSFLKYNDQKKNLDNSILAYINKNDNCLDVGHTGPDVFCLPIGLKSCNIFSNLQEMYPKQNFVMIDESLSLSNSVGRGYKRKKTKYT